MYRGEWGDRHGSYTWQSLSEVALQCGLEWEGDPHQALADARMALGVLRHMAAAARLAEGGGPCNAEQSAGQLPGAKDSYPAEVMLESPASGIGFRFGLSLLCQQRPPLNSYGCPSAMKVSVSQWAHQPILKI